MHENESYSTAVATTLYSSAIQGHEAVMNEGLYEVPLCV